MIKSTDDENTIYYVKWIFIIIIPIICSFFLYGTFVSPYIHIWHQSMAGQAELARAESNRQISTIEAQAKRESSKALAEAEVIRAQGVAEANRIIGDSLAGNESYL